VTLEWVPEYYPPSGGLAAAGFYRLLGRPRLDPLTVLVRETAQNSWDARDGTGAPVLFSIEGWELLPSEVEVLRSEVLTDVRHLNGVDVASVLAESPLHGLFVADRGTNGLGGPFHADVADSEDVYDWVDFVLNVGKANTQGHTGGTYGFGKTISYVVSRINTIVIHTRTVHRGRLQTRLIASAIGEEFRNGRKLGTGRHWWGRSVDGAPAPLTGAAADQLATKLGMPPFEDDQTGTNLLILGPDFGGRTPEQAMRFIAESVTWHLWPKLLDTGSGIPMSINVSWNGEYVHIPEPAERPPLQIFERAFRAICAETADEELGERLDRIQCRRPRTEVGLLGTVAGVRRQRTFPDDGYRADDPDSPSRSAVITGASHHVALLRAPDLVVDYLEGPALPEGELEWAGVFRCHHEHDARFAQAEPPTHDSWNAELLPKGRDRTIVNVGLREIRSSLDARWGARDRAGEGASMNTALIADELAPLIGTVPAQGGGRRDSGGSRSRAASRNPKVGFVGSDVVAEPDGTYTVGRFDVRHASGSPGSRIWITVGVALDGSESDPALDPALALVAASWDGTTVALDGVDDSVQIVTGGPTQVEFKVRRSPSSAVLFDVRAEELPS
jgi:hypothetical protein